MEPSEPSDEDAPRPAPLDCEAALDARTSIYDAARHGAHLHRPLVERMLEV